MFDLASNRWHTFETLLEYELRCGKTRLVSISDGGLVCFLSDVQFELAEKTPPRLVFVYNPLTRVWKQFPPLYGIVEQQRIMVHLIMDRETTKQYRVIVVAYCKDPKVGNLVRVYHSETGQWTKANGGSSSSREVVYGYLCNFNTLGAAPCSYNFADGLVREIVTKFPGNYARESILVQDHLFCLKDMRLPNGLPTGCIIEEYQAMHCGASWTPLKEYPLNLPLGAHHSESWAATIAFASKNFLLLFVFDCLWEEDKNACGFLWLYEFSGEGWRALPMVPPEDLELFCVHTQICELRFNSVP